MVGFVHHSDHADHAEQQESVSGSVSRTRRRTRRRRRGDVEVGTVSEQEELPFFSSTHSLTDPEECMTVFPAWAGLRW